MLSSIFFTVTTSGLAELRQSCRTAAMPFGRRKASHVELISAGPSRKMLNVTGCSGVYDVHPHRSTVDSLMQ